MIKITAIKSTKQKDSFSSHSSYYIVLIRLLDALQVIMGEMISYFSAFVQNIIDFSIFFLKFLFVHFQNIIQPEIYF